MKKNFARHLLCIIGYLFFTLLSDAIFAQIKINPTSWPYGGNKDENRFKKGMNRVPLNFSSAIFDSSIFENQADFGFARFDSIAVFMSSYFKNEAYFNISKFRFYAWLRGSSLDRLAHFGGAHFCDIADFGSAQFKDCAYFRATNFDALTNFNLSHFNSSVIFDGAIFKKLADFSNTNFSYTASFIAVVFDSSVEFGDALVRNQTNFDRAQFKQRVNFTTAKFYGPVKMNRTEFYGVVRFENSDFNSIASFEQAVFNNEVSFASSRFRDYVDFSGSKFNGNANFNRIEFRDNTDFSEVEFNGPTYFIGAKLSNASLIRSKIIDKFYVGSESGQRLDLTRTIFYEKAKLILCDIVDLSIQSEKLIHLFIYDSLNYAIKKLIFDYLKNKSYKEDKESQLELAYIFAKSTMYQNKHQEFYSEISWFNIKRWSQLIYELTMGLGYRPFRLIWFAVILMIIYALLYFLLIPDKVKEYMNSGEKKTKNRTNYSANRFLKFSDVFIACFYFSSMIFFTLRLKKDILAFFDIKEKLIIVTEWLGGFIIYLMFITLSKSGVIFQQLKSLFIG